MCHSPWCFPGFRTGPRLGYDAARGQPPVVAQRPQKEQPAWAQETAQAQLGGPPVAAGLALGVGQRRHGLARTRRSGCPPDTAPPPRGHGHGQPPAGRPLGSGQARARPRPARPWVVLSW